MTDQLRQTLELNYKLAKESGDTQRINDAREAIDRASMECQAHTADRVKRIEAKIEKIDLTLDSINTQMTVVAESREKLMEQYNTTTSAVASLEAQVKTLVDIASGSAKKESRWWDFLTTESFRFFMLILILLYVVVTVTAGKNVADDSMSAAKNFIMQGAPK